MAVNTRIFFVTDIHGSNICFRKFLNAATSAKRADILIVGGDITAKWLVPIVRSEQSGYHASFGGDHLAFETESEAMAYERHLAGLGVYGFLCDRDTAERLAEDEDFAEAALRECRIRRLEQWVEIADRRFAGSSKRVFVNPGNDDPFLYRRSVESE